MSRVEFSKKIKTYLKASGHSQKILANALGWNSTALTHKLNGTGRTIFTQPEIRACILELVKLEAVTRQSEVLDLLKTTNCPNFKPEEWKSWPLSQLTADLPNSNPWAPELTAPVAFLIDSDIANHNLPQPISSFIGRKQDLIKLKRLLLEEKHRLITLVGVGGIGKTRLSITFGKELINSFTDGVWLVELAPVINPTQIPQAISEVLGLLEQPGKSLLDNLARYLHQRHLLLIFDNCEHLIEECSRITDHLLTHSNRLQILATSRENLNITGEVLYQVPYLSLPTPNVVAENLPMKKIEEYEAVKLFVERARAINPEFTFGPDDESSLSRICQRLDGIPLALELAAARTNILSLNQIEARLSDRFQLFTGGSRTELSRHQTLKALIDWSYNLLNEDEKRLLKRASIFVGSWDLEAAEQVCGSEAGKETYEVLDCLTKLVNKSLVLIDKPLDGSPVRYHMLETIREYGLEKLREESGAEKEIRLRHFYFYTDLVKENGPELYEGELLILLKLFDREMDNIRAALDYGLKGEGREADQIMNLFKGLSPYWEVRGFYSEGRYYLEQALVLKEAKDKKNEVSLGYIYNWAGSFCLRQGDNESMKTYFTRAVAISEAHQEDELLFLLCYGSLGVISLVEGDFAGARRHAENVVAWTRGKSNVYQALAMTNLGILLLTLGETDEGGVWLETALPLIRNEKNLHVLVLTLLNLGGFEIIREDYPAAQQHLEEAVSTSELIGFPLGVSGALALLGVIYSFQNKFKEAQQALIKSLNLYLRSGGKIELWPGFEGMVAFLAGLWSESRQAGLLEPLAYFCGVNAKILAAGDWEIRTRLFNQGVEVAKAHLPEEDFNSAFTRGEQLSQEETIAYIRQALSQF